MASSHNMIFNLIFHSPPNFGGPQQKPQSEAKLAFDRQSPITLCELFKDAIPQSRHMLPPLTRFLAGLISRRISDNYSQSKHRSRGKGNNIETVTQKSNKTPTNMVENFRQSGLSPIFLYFM